MKRRLFTILSALSLLLFVAVMVLWVRSLWREEVVVLEPTALVISRDHGVTLITFDRVPHRTPKRRYITLLRREEAAYWDELWSAAEVKSLGVVTLGRVTRWSGNRISLVVMPYWVLAMATAALPIGWLLRRSWSRTKRKTGFCPSCGYDLRATPDRCPECGRVPASVHA